MYDFTGKVALVTGGTSGIGLAATKMLLKDGAQVLIVGIDENEGRQALMELGDWDEQLTLVIADISYPSECNRVVQTLISEFGRLDILINCAGIFIEHTIDEVAEVIYDRIMDVNVKGTFFMCKYAIPQLRKVGGGAIVNVSSDGGLQGNYNCVTYCASKGAITLFTKALALDLARDNIRVNCVCPGEIHTPMVDRQIEAAIKKGGNKKVYLQELLRDYPIGRMGKAEEGAAVICFLASDMASFVLGSSWSVDGGVTAGS